MEAKKTTRREAKELAKQKAKEAKEAREREKREAKEVKELAKREAKEAKEREKRQAKEAKEAKEREKREAKEAEKRAKLEAKEAKKQAKKAEKAKPSEEKAKKAKKAEKTKPAKEKAKEVKTTLTEGVEFYQGMVTLHIAPPVGSAQLDSLKKALFEVEDLRVVMVSGVVGEGSQVLVSVAEALPLLNIIRGIPIVEEAEARGKEIHLSLKAS